MKKLKLKHLNVTFTMKMENHMANCGEKFIGNEITLKKDGNGDNYISGQQSKRFLKDSILDSLQNNLPNCKNTTSDSRICPDNLNDSIENDVRANLFGMMQPEDNLKRFAVIKTTNSKALIPSNNYNDLLLRFSTQDQNHSIVNREIGDDFFNFKWDVDCTRICAEDVNATNLIDDYLEITTEVKMLTDVETKKKWIESILKGLENFCPGANQSRNLAPAYKNDFFVVFNQLYHDNKYLIFFELSLEKKISMLEYLKCEGINYILFDEEIHKHLKENPNQNINCEDNVENCFKKITKQLENYDLNV